MAFNEDGFPKNYNLPGSTGGESNGLYAAVTTNEVVPVDTSVFAQNPGVIQSAFDSANLILANIGNSARLAVQSKAAADTPKAPSLVDQWHKLSAFEQFGFVAAAATLLYMFVRR